MVERNTLNVVVKGSIPLLGVYVATGPHSWAFAPFSPFSGPSLPPDLSRLAERATLNRVVMGSIPMLGAFYPSEVLWFGLPQHTCPSLHPSTQIAGFGWGKAAFSLASRIMTGLLQGLCASLNLSAPHWALLLCP